MTDTSTQQKWLSKFLCDELDDAKAWYGRSKDSLEGNPSFSSISSQPQKPRFSDNGSVLHIANQRGGDQSTTLRVRGQLDVIAIAILIRRSLNLQIRQRRGCTTTRFK